MPHLDQAARTRALKEKLLSKRKRHNDDAENSDSDSEGSDNGVPIRQVRQLDDTESRLDPTDPDTFPSTDEVTKKKKKRKTKASTHQERRKSKKPKDIDDDDLVEGLSINRRIASLSPGMTADWVARRIERFGDGAKGSKLGGSHLTGLEMMDMRIDGESCPFFTSLTLPIANRDITFFVCEQKT